ncbi:MAG: gas vesicle protein GvpG [Acetobacteraceae bacterium]|nr:gas vesicle protein GvpG [Acetobacteraceae bacterium]
MAGQRDRSRTVSLLDFLSWPVTLPIRSLRFILEEIAEAVASEMDDRESLRRRMQELEARYRRGEIDELSFQAAWDELAARWQTADASEGGASPGDGASVGDGGAGGDDGERTW